MKAFTSVPVRQVVLTRVDADGADQQVTFQVQALTPGYTDLVQLWYPPKPKEYVDTKPVYTQEGREFHAGMVICILLAKALRDADPTQIDTPEPPKGAPWEAWDAYAHAIQAEFVAANLVSGDINALVKAMNLANQGAGRPKKAGVGVG